MNILIVNPLSEVSEVLSLIASELYAIRRSNSKLEFYEAKKGKQLLSFKLPSNNVLRFIITQITYAYIFLKVAKKIHVLIVNQETLEPCLTSLLAKLAGKKVIERLGGSRSYLAYFTLLSPNPFLLKISAILSLASLKFSLAISDAIVLNCRALLKDNLYQMYKDKIYVIPNAPPRNFYNVFKVTKEYHRRDFIVGYVAAFTLAKGVASLVHAAKIVARKNPNVKFIFLGDWQRSHPPFLGPLLRKTIEGEANIVFLGSIPHYKVARYMNEMRLLVLPSYTEGTPKVVLEAMACGTPVLATPVGCIPEILANGEHGYIISGRSSEILAEEILKALFNPRNESLSKKIRKYVMNIYNFEQSLKLWIELLKKLENNARMDRAR
ncbi:MAG: glycosyltransferase family 4 protein [Thermofilum sp.]|nr:glycosyltransferase family 4 protein [Thermofilum sp.]